MLRKQNPFIFVPYIMENNVHKHKTLWSKDYINDENMNCIYNINRVFKFRTHIPNNPHHD